MEKYAKTCPWGQQLPRKNKCSIITTNNITTVKCGSEHYLMQYALSTCTTSTIPILHLKSTTERARNPTHKKDNAEEYLGNYEAFSVLL